jgi:molybdate transport system substrate-binding protein
MNTPKRSLGVVAIGAALLLGLAACSSGTATSTPSATTSKAPALTGTITVYGAASLTSSFTTLAIDFEKANPGVTVQNTFNGSGVLVTQIQQGAPADVFASADPAPMKTLSAAGLIDGNGTNFATNILEIATPPSNPANVTSFQDLSKPGTKVVVCQVAQPCGAATAQMEQVTGVTLSPVAEEPSVTAVLTQVTTGQADAGLVYKTDVKGAGSTVHGVPFPESSKVVNVYPIAALKASKNAAVAKAYVDFILGPKGQAVLRAAGFGKP